MKSIDFRGFSAPKGAELPPAKIKKNLSPSPLDKFLNTPLLIVYIFKASTVLILEGGGAIIFLENTFVCVNQL